MYVKLHNKPADATHIDQDFDYLKLENDQWYVWAVEQDDEYWMKVGVTINEQVIKNLGIRPIE